jgi:8-oxo-dGTP diphosphatase
MTCHHIAHDMSSGQRRRAIAEEATRGGWTIVTCVARRSILIRDDGVTKDSGFVLVCSGYLVENGKVLLVHHNRFDKWVPPGGHIEPGETFAETAVREFKEETGLLVEALSAQPVIHPADDNATPEPVPFYVDVEREGFSVPAIVQFFYVRRPRGTDEQQVSADVNEVHEAAWFCLDDLSELPTFGQVRSLAGHALRHYPIEAHRA